MSEATNGDSSSTDPPSRISQELRNFYAEHNVDLSRLEQVGRTGEEDPFPFRFVRLNPRFDRQESLEILGKELIKDKKEDALEPSKPIPVNWIGSEWGFYALPSSFPLASSESFTSGRVYGMDVSSGAGAVALLSSAFDISSSKEEEKDHDAVSDSKDEIRVLDLCCCPGLKLCAMADHFMNKKATIIGVDVSESRMALCKKIVSKYQVSKSDAEAADDTVPPKTNIQLYCQDGTTFGMNQAEQNLVFDTRSALEDVAVRGKRKRMNKSARARERKRLRQIASDEWTQAPPSNNDNDNQESEPKKEQKGPGIKLFDYVLVDAECSTDGSLKHMKERLKSDDPKKQRNDDTLIETNDMLTDQKQLEALVDLQKRLLESGYRLLKPGGKLVYSTCSLSHAQNENVVQWLLKKYPDDCYSIPVHFPNAKSTLIVEGTVKGTMRFYPNLAKESMELFGDGFFLAKLGKRAQY